MARRDQAGWGEVRQERTGMVRTGRAGSGLVRNGR